jgi:hypothetical protein
MKQLIMVVTIALCAAPGVFAANRTVTGKISDSMCGLSHKAMIEHGGGKMTDAQCTEACVKAGAKYVFTSAGKIYALANQDDKDIAMNAGKTVRLTGDMQGTTITVSKITMPAKKAAKKS